MNKQITKPERPWWAVPLTIFLACLGLAMMAIMAQRDNRQIPSGDHSTPRPAQTAEAPAPAAPDPTPAQPDPNRITLADFNRIQLGMTYDQVVEILGRPGQLQSENDLAGFRTQFYTWENNGFMSGTVTGIFQNGKLTNRSQVMIPKN